MPAEKTETVKSEAPKMAIIRIRGVNKVNHKVNDTLSMLNLHRKNYCTIYTMTSSIKGMILKAKDYITWGEIDPETEKLLALKRGEKTEKGELKPYFRLSPPRGGFERKGIKLPFNKGGALGYRKENINELIKRMI